jgi:hypothetical protein
LPAAPVTRFSALNRESKSKKEKGLVNDAALHLLALVRNYLGHRLDAVPRTAESIEISLAFLLGHLLNGLGHFLTPCLDDAHLADALMSLLFGDVSIAAAGELSHGFFHSRYPFQSVRVPHPCDYIIPQSKGKVNPFFMFLRFAQKFLEQLEFFVQNARRPAIRFNALPH